MSFSLYNTDIWKSDYGARYRPELDLVLKDINIKIVCLFDPQYSSSPHMFIVERFREGRRGGADRFRKVLSAFFS